MGVAADLGWWFIWRRLGATSGTENDAGWLWFTKGCENAAVSKRNLTLEIAVRYWWRPTGEPCQQFGPRDVVALATLWVTGARCFLVWWRFYDSYNIYVQYGYMQKLYYKENLRKKKRFFNDKCAWKLRNCIKLSSRGFITKRVS